MKHPLIGITSSVGKNKDDHPTVYLLQAYVDAIQNAGGIPVIIPNSIATTEWDVLYQRLDGILFSGGGDIQTDLFNGSDHPLVDGVEPARDATEMAFLRAAATDGKPFLGICRGAQLMNVALGGTLYTHIHDQFSGQIQHDYPGNRRKALVHPVNVNEDSHAAEIFGETLLHVNSLHHQGLKDIAPNLNAVAHAPDGLVEMVELPDHPYALAVQWHPEWLTDQEPMRKLFQSFIHAARK